MNQFNQQSMYPVPQVMNQARGIRIVRLLVRDTGSYNVQYRRPYITTLDGVKLNVLTECLAGAQSYVPSMLAGVAGEFISLSAETEKTLEIDNGWDTPRMRFMMEIEYTHQIGTVVTEIIQGYTSHVGVSANGVFDPNMTFYANSTLQIRTTQTNTPIGNQNYGSVFDNSHIIVNQNYTDIYSPQTEQRMRPCDVYSAMAVNHLPDAGNIKNSNTLVTNIPAKSRRRNNTAESYMADVLENYRKAAESVSLNGGGHGVGGENDIFTEARSFSSESLINTDPFLKALSTMRQMPPSNTFRFADLQMLDPNVNSDEVTKVMFMSSTERANAHHNGQTEYWHGSDLYTQTAAILSNTIPSVMMDNVGMLARFYATNRELGGNITVTVFNFEGFNRNMNMAQFATNFTNSIIHGVLRSITQNNSIDFAIDMDVDLLGETKIKMSLDNGRIVDYSTPSFCDAMMVPVLTGIPNIANTLSRDFEGLFASLRDIPQGEYGTNAPNFNSF